MGFKEDNGTIFVCKTLLDILPSKKNMILIYLHIDNIYRLKAKITNHKQCIIKKEILSSP